MRQEAWADLIHGLTILRKYATDGYPTNCSHDVLWVNVDPANVPEDVKKDLAEIGFIAGEGEFDGGFYSFRFGSC
jgi:hypothetical protein